MTAQIAVWVRWFAYTLLLASAVPAGLTVSQLIRARRAPYYALRREAFRRAKRWILVALVLQASAALLLFAQQTVAEALKAELLRLAQILEGVDGGNVHALPLL